MDAKTLLVIPCCKDKATSGTAMPSYSDPLASLVSSQQYDDMLKVRFELLSTIRTASSPPNGEGETYNTQIRDGFDFGKSDSSGLYREAITRYAGFLYSVPGFSADLRKALGNPDSPRVLILSALYGPLHPLTPIQDYDLRMEDKTAREAWKSAWPGFMNDYISRNGIRVVRLDLGRTTAYLKVASHALRPLIERGMIEATYYDVEGGTSRETPRNHGIRFLADLGQSSSLPASRVVTEKPL